MNTNTVTVRELSNAPSNYNNYTPSLRKAAITTEIANRAIVALAARGPMKSSEIAAAIGDVGIDFPVIPTAQSVGCVMRKLVAIGRVKVEKVKGKPIEVNVSAISEYERWDFKNHCWKEPREAGVKTIIPTINYYSLV